MLQIISNLEDIRSYMWAVIRHPRPIDLHDRTGTGTDTTAVIKVGDDEKDDKNPRACHAHKPDV